jgi:large subunit ribosomal protein L7e
MFYVDAEPKYMLVIRVKGIAKVPPKPRKILQLFRLLSIHNAILLINNRAT